MESGPGPPVSVAPELQTPHLPETPELRHSPVPQQRPLPSFPPFPPFPSWPPLPPVPQLPRVPQAVEAVEVIDLTGLSDEDVGDEWEDVPDIIDLTNLPSDDEDGDDDHNADEEIDDVPQNYTILNLPPRRYTSINGPPVPLPLPGQTRSARRAARAAARAAARVSARVSARVPIRRDICELCARVVRWGPGCLITKHHLYPQEITKKYPDRYTQAEKKSIALLCRPCHDACHRAHSNGVLADFYNQVDLLKADPNIQAHISSMQRATTPELIARHGDGINVRRKKERVRAAMTYPHKVLALKQGKALSRPNLRERALGVPPPPPGVRRSARLLAKSTGDQSQVPVIVIEDEGEDTQDGVIHEEAQGKENEKMQGIVIDEELAVLEALGEYIRL
ncbi:hypothetical protein INS49_010153 [Diaporthe citri]|uniref:uncharacterized protein n=1 Tax=Diaporthe citri TaxID=83186 RepID=UPI001C7F77E2|nr:uncharacterized protein INS49_010153 [Diaporthe citri]KAG6361924.1 hypothetical protein INS49_010153 [Diaporthe citri]